MEANKVFVKDLNDYYDGNNDCNSIIIPNTFGIRKVDCDLIIGKIDNKEIRITEKICMNFSLIGNYIWNCLSMRRKYLNYAIIGYIANAIKYNSNIIRITPDTVKCIVNAEVSNRTYQEAIADLKRCFVIKNTSVRGMYEVNPLAVFKGSVFKLLDIAEEYGIKGFVDDGDKVILDKFAITEDKEGKKVKVILNGKYHNKSNKDNKEVKQINCDNIRYSFDE